MNPLRLIPLLAAAMPADLAHGQTIATTISSPAVATGFCHSQVIHKLFTIKEQ